MRWINIRPSRTATLLLAVLPFALLVAAYLAGSAARLAVNDGDKLLPSLVSLTDAINRMAFTPDTRTGDYLLWSDTLASLSRLGWGLAISTLIALVVGMVVGMLPTVRALLAPVIAVIAMVPPLALLPILFILLGLGETAKIAVTKLANEGYTQWTIHNPGKSCPQSIDDLTKEVDFKSANDPWGNPYVMLCGDSLPPGARGIAIQSWGEDKKQGTPDDIKSWE